MFQHDLRGNPQLHPPGKGWIFGEEGFLHPMLLRLLQKHFPINFSTPLVYTFPTFALWIKLIQEYKALAFANASQTTMGRNEWQLQMCSMVEVTEIISMLWRWGKNGRFRNFMQYLSNILRRKVSVLVHVPKKWFLLVEMKATKAEKTTNLFLESHRLLKGIKNACNKGLVKVICDAF